MKKLMILCCMMVSLVGNAQTIPDFDLIKLEKVSDYKAAEPFALQTAIYLLSTPVEKKGENRMKSLEFLFKWMQGTSDHSFVLDEAAAKFGKDNKDILGLYMAGMVKYTLENKNVSKDPKLTRLNAVKLLLDYCENPSNHLKLTKQLKKLSEARAKGELEQAL